MVDLDTLVQEKIEADADFQEEIAQLEEVERDTKLEEKRKEVLSSEFERLAKADELAKNYKARAEKAEALAKASKHTAPENPETPKNAGELSSKDMFALIKANVNEDDVDEVIRVSKILGVSVQEAIKDSAVITILEKREEKRKSADAMNTKSNRSTRKGTTDKELIAQASKGEIPDAGSDEAERLFWARRGVKR